MSSGPETSSTAVPDAADLSEICGYPVDSVLQSTRADEPDFLGPSYLAIGPGGRGIVLKPLDRDCILTQGLHPSIKERLGRVRELALGGVANLYGVERDPGDASRERAWLIWEYVRGRTLTDYASDAGCTQRKLALVARELVLLLEALHRQGIVHGAICGSNVIVDAHGNVRLTHVSPLLYTDPTDDLWGVVNAMQTIVHARDEEKSPLGLIVTEIEQMLDPETGPAPGSEALLRIFGTKLSGVIEARDRVELSPGGPPEPAHTPRRRSLAGATFILLLALAAAYAGWRLIKYPDNPLPGWLEPVRGWLQT